MASPDTPHSNPRMLKLQHHGTVRTPGLHPVIFHQMDDGANGTSSSCGSWCYSLIGFLAPLSYTYPTSLQKMHIMKFAIAGTGQYYINRFQREGLQ